MKRSEDAPGRTWTVGAVMFSTEEGVLGKTERADACWNRSAGNAQRRAMMPIKIQYSSGGKDEKMSGRFTGIGVGPGDPELLTLKAVRMIRECHVAAVPVSDPGLSAPCPMKRLRFRHQTVHVRLIWKNVPHTRSRSRLSLNLPQRQAFLPMPMIKDKTALKEIHDRDASAAAKLLEEGRIWCS